MKHQPNRTRQPLTLAVLDRFWPNVDRSGECWMWTGKRDIGGYGVFYAGGGDFRAHRVAYEFATDVAPGDMFVCHTCDNPSCVRPEHLFLGTTQANTADRHAKRRDARGSRSGSAKLTESDVALIRSALLSGEKQVDLARRFGVSQAAISLISMADTWAGADRDDNRSARRRHARGERSGSAKLTSDVVVKIRAALRAGESQRAIAERFGTRQQTVSAIATGRTWRHVE